MLTSLNPQSPLPDAHGFLAPYIRVATHLGFQIAWLGLTTDEDWANEDSSSEVATKSRLIFDLQEAKMHVSTAAMVAPNAYVSAEMVGLMNRFREQLDELLVDMPTERTTVLTELTTLAHNLAYVAARLERSFTGSTLGNEGSSI